MSGIFFVSSEFFCLKDPDAAFLGFANLSFIFKKSFFSINTSPLISISFGKSGEFTIFGISLIVFKFSVINSPTFPSPLETPYKSFLFLKVNEAEIPSILGSTL